MKRSPTWVSHIRGQLAEIDALDIPYMLDRLAEMQEFIDYTKRRLEDMQKRKAVIERHLEGLEEET